MRCSKKAKAQGPCPGQNQRPLLSSWIINWRKRLLMSNGSIPATACCSPPALRWGAATPVCQLLLLHRLLWHQCLLLRLLLNVSSLP